MMATCPGCGTVGWSDPSDPASACRDCADEVPKSAPTGFTLRDYQQECLDAHLEFFTQDPEGHPLMVLPTGSGKSVIQAAFLRDTLATWPEERILCLTHVRELIAQNHERLLTLWPEAPAGVYSAGLGRREVDRITFAGVQSVYRKAQTLGHVDLVLVDECHLIPKQGAGMYRTLLDGLREINPALRLIGYTATPYRLDGGYLHEGADRIFSAIAYDLSVRRLIDAGHLAPLVARAPEHAIDTSGVKKRGGEFVAGELDRKAANEDDVHAAVTEALELTRKANRKHWLIFACGVHHAELILAELVRQGVNARAVFGHTKKDQRTEVIADAKAGKLTAIVNVAVLTTGFDWPACDALWMMRPTESTGLYVQMLGRGMRTAPGKTDCLVLDYGENVLRHGPVDDVRIKDPGEKGEGEAPAKACKACGLIVPTATRACPECGYEWPRPEPKVQRTASTAAPLATPQDWLDVDRMELRRHEKFGRPDSVRVIYHCGFRTVSEWVCPEHGGYATAKFRRWWQDRGGQMPIPTTADETLNRDGELDAPERILVERDGKYERIRKSA